MFLRLEPGASADLPDTSPGGLDLLPGKVAQLNALNDGAPFAVAANGKGEDQARFDAVAAVAGDGGGKPRPRADSPDQGEGKRAQDRDLRRRLFLGRRRGLQPYPRRNQRRFRIPWRDRAAGALQARIERDHRPRRGGQGIINIATSPRNGPVVASFAVKATDQLMLVTDAGKLIRIPVSDIRIAGRNTQGVTLFRTKKCERVVSVIRLGAESEIDNIGGDENTEGDKADEPEELAGDMENEL